MRPASATVSMSRPVERKAMSAGWPATMALACDPEGPYDGETVTSLPAGRWLKRAMSFPTTAFGVEYATRFSVEPDWRACAAPTQARTTGRIEGKSQRFRIGAKSFLGITYRLARYWRC